MGVNQATRQQVSSRVWAHIKANRLLQPGPTGGSPQVQLDDTLAGLFRADKGTPIPFDSIEARLAPLMSAPQPKAITYKIRCVHAVEGRCVLLSSVETSGPGRLDGPSPSHPEAYDFDIMVPTTAFEAALPAQTGRVGMEVEGDQVCGTKVDCVFVTCCRSAEHAQPQDGGDVEAAP